MADKFPELDEDIVQDVFVGGDETDFLKREAEILGDEFKTEQDSEFLSAQKSENSSFEKDFPELDENINAGTSVNEAEALAAAKSQEEDFGSYEHANTGSDDDFGEPQTSSEQANREPSQAIKNWRERRELEIAERDQAEDKAKLELQEEAARHIDDFYENYNIKKQHGIEETKAEAEKFLKQTNGFASQDITLWDKVLQLINIEDADIVEDRDRSKFKEILLRLKGNASAPGASGN